MFFRPSIKSGAYPILEVGPGAFPHPSSDVWLDFEFNERDRIAQSGHAKPASGRPLVYYTGGRFPFKDQAFRYVIASHVLEHIPWDQIPAFIAELERVAPAGYIELPRWTYEMLNDVPEHVSTGDVREGVLHLYRKTPEHGRDAFTSVLMEKSRRFQKYVKNEKELFFCRLEWRGSVPLRLHEDDYPPATSAAEIKTAASSDCDRLVPMWSSLAAAELADLKKGLGKYAGAISNQLRRKIVSAVPLLGRKKISDMALAEMLRCPACGHSINADWHCDQCKVGFKKDPDGFHPILRL